MPEDEYYEVQNKEIQALLRNIGVSLKRDMPPGWGFTLLIFSFKSEGLFYISSAERTTMIAALKETIGNLENLKKKEN